MKNFILTLVCVGITCVGLAQEIPFRLAVYDKMNRYPIVGAQVKLEDMSSLREYKMISNDTGFTYFKLLPATRYRLEVSKNSTGVGEGYLSYAYMLSEKEVASKRTFEAELEKVKHTDSGLLPAMRFEYNTATLNAENLASLDNVAKMLSGFPTLQIEIGLYADCREDTNITTKRAAAISNYLSTKGGGKHIVVKEYGNVRALNQCDCSNKNFVCPEEKYVENRRAEFKVISF